MKDERYVIVRLSDAKILARCASAFALLLPADTRRTAQRLLDETGADMRDIVEQLRNMPFCAACRHEGQEHSCNALHTNRLGRRLRRLVERADGTWPPTGEKA